MASEWPCPGIQDSATVASLLASSRSGVARSCWLPALLPGWPSQRRWAEEEREAIRQRAPAAQRRSPDEAHVPDEGAVVGADLVQTGGQLQRAGTGRVGGAGGHAAADALWRTWPVATGFHDSAWQGLLYRGVNVWRTGELEAVAGSSDVPSWLRGARALNAHTATLPLPIPAAMTCGVPASADHSMHCARGVREGRVRGRDPTGRAHPQLRQLRGHVDGAKRPLQPLKSANGVCFRALKAKRGHAGRAPSAASRARCPTSVAISMSRRSWCAKRNTLGHDGAHLTSGGRRFMAPGKVHVHPSIHPFLGTTPCRGSRGVLPPARRLPRPSARRSTFRRAWPSTTRLPHRRTMPTRQSALPARFSGPRTTRASSLHGTILFGDAASGAAFPAHVPSRAGGLQRELLQGDGRAAEGL